MFDLASRTSDSNVGGHGVRGSKGMSFASQSEAKQFYIDKIVAQALKDNEPLTDAERYMLNWTETDKEFKIDVAMNRKFDEETTDEKFEKKIRSLLTRVYEADIRENPKLRKVYCSAYRAITTNDHYILIIIRDALGRKFRRWWLF